MSTPWAGTEFIRTTQLHFPECHNIAGRGQIPKMVLHHFKILSLAKLDGPLVFQAQAYPGFYNRRGMQRRIWKFFDGGPILEMWDASPPVRYAGKAPSRSSGNEVPQQLKQAEKLTN